MTPPPGPRSARTRSAPTPGPRGTATATAPRPTGGTANPHSRAPGRSRPAGDPVRLRAGTTTIPEALRPAERTRAGAATAAGDARLPLRAAADRGGTASGRSRRSAPAPRGVGTPAEPGLDFRGTISGTARTAGATGRSRAAGEPAAPAGDPARPAGEPAGTADERVGAAGDPTAPAAARGAAVGPTVPEALRRAERTIAGAGVAEAALDARLLLRAAAGWSAAELVAEGRQPISPALRVRFEDLVRERAARRPLQHLTGRVEFFGLSLAVGREALIPRPETEILVEAVLDFLRDHRGAEDAGGRAAAGRALRIADVGCGAGPIALALAAETAPPTPTATPRAPDAGAPAGNESPTRPATPAPRPAPPVTPITPVTPVTPITVVGFEIEPAALALADRNRRETGLAARVALVRGDLLEAARPGSFAVVAANLPYVPRAEIERLEPEVRDHEPRRALDGGADGLDPLRRLLPLAARALAPEGALFLEIGAGQQEAASGEIAAAGFRLSRVVPDLAGIPRVLAAAPPPVPPGPARRARAAPPGNG